MTRVSQTILIKLTGNIQGLIRFWRSKVEVTAGHRGGKGIRVDDWVLKSIF